MYRFFRKLIYSIALLSFAVANMDAQEKYQNRVSSNFGMTSRHDPVDLPHSRTDVVFPVKTPGKLAEARIVAFHDNVWKVTGGWELADADSLVAFGGVFGSDHSRWMVATVPGTVLTTLVDRGVYPDPYFGLNNMAIPEDLCRKDWWYRTTLPLSDEILSAGQIELLFEGINYRADVWFNSEKLGSMKGAFARGRFDITSIAGKENTLAVHIFPPDNPGIPHEQSARTGRGPNGGVLCLDGPTFISSEGWDWVPGVRDRNIGIWQDVELVVSGGITIQDPRVVTDLPLPRTDSAALTVSATLKNSTDKDTVTEITASVGDINVSKTVEVPARSSVGVEFTPREFTQLVMDNPRLWMPNGYGQQNLYTLSLSCGVDGKVSDKADVRFGVREYTYELTVDSHDVKGLRINYSPTDMAGMGHIFDNRSLRHVGDGVVVPSLREGTELGQLEVLGDDATAPYLVVRCNGVRIFCRGGNWGMDDMMKRCSREHLEPYFKLHKEAGFTMVRNWTGENTEEVFYQLCDEYGLMVWNDFWMSTEGYNLDPSDEELFMSNAEDVVKRFRNHPSIAIWCPRNEGYATESLEEKLSTMVAAQDGTRFWSPNSRYCNLRTSGPWHYLTNAAEYYTDIAAGFSTELGSPSVPTARTMRKFMPAEDLWPIGDAWHYHDLHPETGTYVEKVSLMYGDATGLDDFCRKVQIMNYDSYRAMFESWNSRMWNNTTGVLLWMSHPAWPSVEWQTYSYDYETFGSWFGSRKACERIHVQLNLNDHKVVIVNNSLEELRNLTVKLDVYALDGSKLQGTSSKIPVAKANSLTEAFLADLPWTESPYLVRLSLLDGGRRQLSINDYLLDPTGAQDFRKLNDIPEVTLKAKKERSWKDGDDTIMQWTVVNPSRNVAFFVKLDLESLSDGTQVLPAIFSDGYFNLLPGEKKVLTVRYSCGATMGSATMGISAEGYNVNPKITCE